MKRKPNALDIIVIAVIVIALAGTAAFKLFGAPQGAGAKTWIAFDVLATELTLQEAESIKEQIGGSVVFGKTKSDTGVIRDVAISPHRVLTKNTHDGTFSWQDHPLAYQAVITVETEVTETDLAFTGVKEDVCIGVSMPLLGKGFGVANPFVIDVREVSK